MVLLFSLNDKTNEKLAPVSRSSFSFLFFLAKFYSKIRELTTSSLRSCTLNIKYAVNLTNFLNDCGKFILALGLKSDTDGRNSLLAGTGIQGGDIDLPLCKYF